MDRYWAELKIKDATEGWITITLNGQFKAGGLVQVSSGGREAIIEEGHRIANRWAENRKGVIDRFVTKD